MGAKISQLGRARWVWKIALAALDLSKPLPLRVLLHHRPYHNGKLYGAGASLDPAISDPEKSIAHIYAPLDKAEQEWRKLKHRIQNNQPVYIRGFGSNSNGIHLFQDFYEEVCGNEHVTVDPTNNAIPTKIFTDLTGYSKSPRARHAEIRN